MQYKSVQQLALENSNFRKVLFTNKHSQGVLMSIHDFTNTGNEAMKLFTVYSPPEHPDGVVHATKADALAHPDE
jgi:hypothetical protein